MLFTRGRKRSVWIRIGILLAVLAVLLSAMTWRPEPKEITYGMSFNTFYAQELGLDWKEVYDAMLDEMNVRNLRLAAHWPMIEPNQGEFDFSVMDYQMNKAFDEGATVILAIGRRLPRWPECHIPKWATDLSWEEQKAELRDYLEVMVLRYKDHPALRYWQVENEPYLKMFAYERCGELDEEFLEEEIALVKKLDPDHPVLLTDSGNLGLWAGAYKRGDLFGTSVYVHFWNPELGQFRTVLPPAAYRFKTNLMRLLFGYKETLLIELSAEPWLVAPIAEVDVETQFSRMNLESIRDIIEYARKTRFDRQYLWGVEWWYWLKEKGYPEIWDYGVDLFKN
tara:strand:+ start:2278 stop:3291 length:1014 start_codon:yes stop_codon:yes gene_type:complete